MLSFSSATRIGNHAKNFVPLAFNIHCWERKPLVKKGCLYGDYYHLKKEKGKRPGNKAMTIVMRNFIKKFYGWYKAGKAFDEKRFFDSQRQYLKAA